MSQKEEILWYFALCDCIHTDDSDLLFSQYYMWADDLYNTMIYKTRLIAKRYDEYLQRTFDDQNY